MSEQPFFLKGYKFDLEKIRRTFPKTDQDLTVQNYEITWIQPIVDTIPREAYKYIKCGVEQNGDLNLVMVLDDGYDAERLKKEPVDSDDEMLAQAARDVLTAGVWPARN